MLCFASGFNLGGGGAMHVNTCMQKSLKNTVTNCDLLGYRGQSQPEVWREKSVNSKNKPAVAFLPLWYTVTLPANICTTESHNRANAQTYHVVSQFNFVNITADIYSTPACVCVCVKSSLSKTQESKVKKNGCGTKSPWAESSAVKNNRFWQEKNKEGTNVTPYAQRK